MKSMEIGWDVDPAINQSDYSVPMDTVQVGGEAEDYTGKFNGVKLQMGSGNPASAGYGWAAYHHDFGAYWGTGYTTSATVCATRPNDYSESTTVGAGMSTWGSYFYYGGTPPAKCVPLTCMEATGGCGSLPDGCGGKIACGCRISGQSGQSNVCIPCKGRIRPK